jgi:uncharacterized ion transporter superfamily protein YfcC
MEPQEAKNPTILSVGLKFGLILGVVSVAITLVRFVIGNNPMESNWMNNVISLILVVTAVVLAHKSFKETGDGFMSYGQGLGIAMVTVIVSTIVSGLFLYVYLNYVDTAAWDSIWEKAEEDMQAQGQSEEAIEMGLGWGKKLFWVIFPVAACFWGLLIGLIVSIFTQKKSPETAF